MLKFSDIRSSLIITAATIGSGVFALPYVIAQAGWLLTLGYFAALGAVIITAHAVYLKTLAAEGEKERLLGLAQRYFGATGFWFGFIGIVVGLLLSFVIFLILGAQFLQLIFPTIPKTAALLVFWLIIAIPALIGNRRVVALELTSVLSVAAIIIFVFTSSHPTAALTSIPAITGRNFFLPFGAVLFMLAGWTGVEPFYESIRGDKKRTIFWKLALGTGIAALLYLMFANGILASTPNVVSDTLSGLATWPGWKRALIGILGTFAVGTCSGSISHEIRNALEKDLQWNHVVVRLIIIGAPLTAILLGFNNFLLIVGLAGGLFIGMQYILIIAVARRALALSSAQKLWLDVIAIVFAIAAIYEIARLI